MRRFEFSTPMGTFTIAVDREARWQISFAGEMLDTMPSPEDAALAVAGGCCMWPTVGNPRLLEVPSELSSWRVVVERPGKATGSEWLGPAGVT